MITAPVGHVSNAPSGAPEVLVRGRAGERLVAAGDPQPVQDPAVAGLRVGPGGVALIAQRLDRAEQGLEFEQRGTVRADVAHRDVTVTRSGADVLVAQRPVGVDRDLSPRRPLELEHAGQVPVVGDVAAQAAGRGGRQGGDAVPGGELDPLGGVRADLLPGRGRQVRWPGKRLAHVRPSPGHQTGRPREPLVPTAE